MTSSRIYSRIIHALITTVCALTLMCAYPLYASADDNVVPDPVLRATINQWLGRGAEEALTPDILGGLAGPEIIPNSGLRAFPSLEGLGIHSLEGLQYVHPSNVYFTVSQNPLENLLPLTKLPHLMFLTANNCGLTTIQELAESTDLRGLQIADNKLKDLTPLTQMTSLTQLNIANNAELQSLHGLENIPDGARIAAGSLPNLQDITALHHKKLSFTWSSGKTIPESIYGVFSTNLGNTFIAKNTPFSSVPVLSDASNIQAIWIENNPNLASLAEMAEITSATNIKITKNPQLHTLAGIEHNTNATTLEADENALEDISALSSLTNLTSLVLDRNNLSDISAVAPLTKLTKLSCSWNQIRELSALSNLHDLKDLIAMYNQIEDVSGVPIKLYHLFVLSNNHISDVSPLKGVTSTNHIDLQNNRVQDISPLSQSGYYDTDSAGATANEWVFMDDQYPVIQVTIGPDRTLKLKNPIVGMTSSAWDQFLTVNDPDHLQNDPEKAKKVYPYLQDDRTWGWEPYMYQFPGMTVRYDEDDDTIIWENIPEDATELYFDFSKNYWTGARGAHWTPFHGHVTLLINNAPIIVASDKTISQGATFDPLEGVSASDKEDGELDVHQISVSYKQIKSDGSADAIDHLDTNIPGTYLVAYQIQDSQGALGTRTITLTVVPTPTPEIPHVPTPENPADTTPQPDSQNFGSTPSQRKPHLPRSGETTLLPSLIGTGMLGISCLVGTYISLRRPH